MVGRRRRSNSAIDRILQRNTKHVSLENAPTSTGAGEAEMATVAPPDASQSAAPNQSLYLQDLPDKLPRDDLKRALYMLFSTYGPVIDVTAVKSAKMRGQAHVLFKDTQTASQAMRQCQGLDFFGRGMVCERKSLNEELPR